MEKEQQDPKANPELEQKKPQEKEGEFGGFENKPEPTRHGDWEVNGRTSDF
jgi:hypothetical protein